jgi:exonuclease V gamma subunit
MLTLFYSNSIKNLSSHFISLVGHRKSPTEKKGVVTAHPLYKKYLIQALMANQGISFGIEWLSLEGAIKRLTSNKVEELPKEMLYLALLEKWGETSSQSYFKAQYLAEQLSYLSRFEPQDSNDPYFLLLTELSEKYQWPLPFTVPLSFGGDSSIKELHIFDLSYIPKQQLLFFENLSENIPVYIYQFSPSSLYIGDLLSDQEIHRLKKIYFEQKKEITSIAQWEKFATDRHPLLASLGKKNIEMMNQLLEKTCEEREDYSDLKKHLLGCVQKEIVYGSCPFSWDYDDASIRLFPCGDAKYKEVERVDLCIKDLLSKDQALSLSDIAIYAPNIEDYRLWLESICDYPLSFQKGSNKDSSNAAACFFLDMILFPATLSMLWQFFSFSSVQKRLGIDLSDSVKWRTLFSDLHILSLFENEQAHTSIENGIKRMIRAFSKSPIDDPLMSQADLGMNEAEAMNGLFVFVQEMEKWLLWKEKRTDDTPQKWAEEIEASLSLMIDLGSDGVLERTLGIFKRELLLFQEKSEATFTIKAVAYLLRQKLQQGATHQAQLEQNAVRCLSITPSVVPSKVTILIGMEEGIFPRHECPRPSFEDYVPTKNDDDRYAFLEMLMKTEDFFWIFYKELSEEDGKTEYLSPIVSEFFQYLFEKYGIKKEDLTIHFPKTLYSEDFYTKKAKLPKPSKIWFKCAQSRQNTIENKPMCTLERVLSLEEFPEETIRFQRLLTLAKSPIQFYLNQRDIYLEYENAEDEEVILSPWMQKKQIEALLNGKKISQYLKEGIYPGGTFESIALEKLMRETKRIRQYCFDQRLTINTLDADILTEANLPFSFSGSLGLFSEKGPVILAKNSLEQAIRIWPQICLFSCLHPGVVTTVSFLKSETEKEIPCDNPLTYLSKFMQFVKLAEKELFPFTASSIGPFLKGNPQFLEVSIQGDRYAKWLCRQKQIKLSNEKAYRELFMELYQPILRAYGI